MFKHSRWIIASSLVLVVLLVVNVGCSKKPKPVVVPPPATTQTTPETPPPTPPPAETTTQSVLDLKDVFFDYDRSALRDDARNVLGNNGKMLVDNESANVLLEGHCDERGTVEYNLALGERRATAVRAYLIQYGVDPSRVSTISYGEERPFVQGQDESAWSQNRRVHFVKQ